MGDLILLYFSSQSLAQRFSSGTAQVQDLAALQHPDTMETYRLDCLEEAQDTDATDAKAPGAGEGVVAALTW